jgi:hypothetical protein
MAQSKFQKLNLPTLRKAAEEAGIEPESGWKKQDFVDALEAHDKGRSAAEELGDLPPPSQAPDESDGKPAFQPSTKPPPAPKPPPPPPSPEDAANIPPEKMPPTPKRYKLMNDVTWVRDGLPVKLKAGRILQDNHYDIPGLKAKGCVLVEERVFEARAAKG